MAIIKDKEERCQRIDELIKNGKGVCDSCRELGISEKTYYRWKRAQESGAK